MLPLIHDAHTPKESTRVWRTRVIWSGYGDPQQGSVCEYGHANCWSCSVGNNEILKVRVNHIHLHMHVHIHACAREQINSYMRMGRHTPSSCSIPFLYTRTYTKKNTHIHILTHKQTKYILTPVCRCTVCVCVGWGVCTYHMLSSVNSLEVLISLGTSFLSYKTTNNINNNTIVNQ